MDACDVLIVGGGPAGSACAWALSRAGIDVAILDKSVFPRDKVCGGWITPQVIETLEIDPSGYSCARTLQPITGFATSCMGDRETQTIYDRPVSYGIRRVEFDDYLLRRSAARLFAGEPVRTLERVGKFWVVNGHIRARMLVGAGGHFCPVARQVNPGWQTRSNRRGAGSRIRNDAGTKGKCARFAERFPNFISAAISAAMAGASAKEIISMSVSGRLDSHGLGAHVTGFVDFLRRTRKVEFDLPSRFWATPICFTAERSVTSWTTEYC